MGLKNFFFKSSVAGWMWMGILSSCSAEPQRPPPKDGKILVGRLTRQYDPICRGEQGDAEWKNPHYQIGFIPLDSASKKPASSLENQLVVAEGVISKKRPNVARVPEHGWVQRSIPVAYCGTVQSRSDWVISKSGIRLLRKVPPPVAEVDVFAATELRPLKDFGMLQDGGIVTPVFKNIFPSTLHDVKIIAHYEGCFKKAGTEEKAVERQRLAPGEKISTSFPTYFTQNASTPEREELTYVLASIQVASSDDSILLDFDWPVEDLDIPACPKVRK